MPGTSCGGGADEPGIPALQSYSGITHSNFQVPSRVPNDRYCTKFSQYFGRTAKVCNCNVPSYSERDICAVSILASYAFSPLFVRKETLLVVGWEGLRSIDGAWRGGGGAEIAGEIGCFEPKSMKPVRLGGS